MEELRHGSVEETRRMIANATVSEIRPPPPPPPRRMEQKDQSNYVVFPLPKIDHRKPNEYSTSGKEIKLTVNAYPITKVPMRPVYMYEVSKMQKPPALTRL
jgi:hypothetical protein